MAVTYFGESISSTIILVGSAEDDSMQHILLISQLCILVSDCLHLFLHIPLSPSHLPSKLIFFFLWGNFFMLPRENMAMVRLYATMITEDGEC